MNQFVLFAAAAEAESGNIVTNITTRFGVTKELFISQLIAFLVVAFLLKKFAYQPVLTMLEERRQRIAEGMENAEKIKVELANTEAARKKVMEDANATANKMIEEARAVAAQVQEKESQKVKEKVIIKRCLIKVLKVITG